MKKFKTNQLIILLFTVFDVFSLVSLSAFAADSENTVTTGERILNGTFGGVCGLAIGGAAVAVAGLICMIIYKSKPIAKSKTKGIHIFLLGIIALVISAILYFLLFLR